MVGSYKYTGNPRRAARLVAARRAAGYATAREAAQKFGWPEPRYRSHEGAIRDIDRVTLKDYAGAFEVSERWLAGGEPSRDAGIKDSKIVVDQNRERQLELRIEAQSRPAAGDNAARGRRLRLARRLAGFATAKAGAAAAEVHPTTLNGAERGLSAFDVSVARKYAAAFGCEPTWLTEGTPPSGYPPDIAARLPQLMALHDEPDRDVAGRMPFYDPPARTTASPAFDLRSEPAPPGEPLPEYEIDGLVRILDKPASRPAAARGWAMPAAFLNGVLRADASGCVILAVPRRTSTGGFPVAPGDRLIVDTTVKEIFAAVYAVVVEGTLVIADARNEQGRGLALDAARWEKSSRLLGQIVGTVAGIR